MFACYLFVYLFVCLFRWFIDVVLCCFSSSFVAVPIFFLCWSIYVSKLGSIFWFFFSFLISPVFCYRFLPFYHLRLPPHPCILLASSLFVFLACNCLSIYLYFALLAVSLSNCLFIVCLSIYLFRSFLSVCLIVQQSVCLPASLQVCVSTLFMSVCV